MSPPENPFQRRPRGRWLGVAAFLVLLVSAVALAIVASRHRNSSSAQAAHEHAAVAGSDSAGAVSLGAAEAGRIGVTYSVATAGPLEHTVRAVAVVTFDERRVRIVATRLEGFVERLFADYTGRYVRAGEPLLALYAPMAVATQQEFVLARRLERDVAAGTPEAQASARSAVDAARQRLRLWEIPEETVAEVERTGAVQRTVTLRAPFAGYLIEKSVLLGQRVMPGDPLYKVADLSVVWLEGEIFERDLPALRVGGKARATFQALPGTERRGRITYISPTLGPETRTVRVRVELANPDFALKPGMYATLQFSGPIAEGLSVPRSAVVVTGRRNLVFRKGPDGRFVPREVELGITADDRAQILGGLVAGDTVVASATFLIDAESNLGSQLGGMGNMPGMDMAPPDSSRR
ncbi:MAG TPA: efflux RND transporter periplasmic adaptor subunit [Gemmatimonadales bacterium]|nr:efflux RND transporter periplasmic adaptor subunit [Gemmatimonadales bacterium]